LKGIFTLEEGTQRRLGENRGNDLLHTEAPFTVIDAVKKCVKLHMFSPHLANHEFRSPGFFDDVVASVAVVLCLSSLANVFIIAFASSPNASTIWRSTSSLEIHKFNTPVLNNDKLCHCFFLQNKTINKIASKIK
jgi:hypothetical protein